MTASCLGEDLRRLRSRKNAVVKSTFGTISQQVRL